jgi:predicted phage terminase large subunit-like protein
MPLDFQTRQAAAIELLARRKARSSLLASIQYTAPWFITSWHHELVCALLERVDGIAEDQHIVVKVGNTNPVINTEVDGVTTSKPNPAYKQKTVKLPAPKHIKRLMVFAPPRHSKSEIVSVRRPAWSIGKDRKRMYMNIAYGSDLALTFSKACVGTMLSESYQNLFPVEFDRKANERWKVKRPEAEDNQRDSMIASGIMSPLTGEGATDVNVDDPFKNKSEAYSKTIRDKVGDEYQTSIRTRLQKNATVCVMLTRWHQDDLAGRLIKQALANKRADQWIVLVLAAWNDSGESSYLWDTATGEKTFLPPYDALWPGLFERSDLESTKASMASAFWEAMYMQAPTTASGSIFKADKWKEFPLPITVERLVHVWDTAMEDTETADYSAHVALGVANGRFIVKSAYRERLTFPDLIRQVYAKWDEDVVNGYVPERLLIEQKGSGISLLQTIEANNLDPFFTGSRIPVLGMPATLSKEVRALSISGYQEAGLAYLPKPETDIYGDVIPATFNTMVREDGTGGQQIEWVADFIEEHTAFPKGANDDWVDCFVHGCTYYTRPHGEEDYSEIAIFDSDEVTISSELDSIDGRGF